MMNGEKIAGLQKNFVMPTYAPELLLTRGEGSYVWDDKGTRYLDFASGISVCNLGHCHPAVTAAIREQAGKLVHVSNLYMNEKQPLLAATLIEKAFDGVVFFSNSGAEANEGMIKFARKRGGAKGKSDIITMENSFHGRTLATLAATGQTKYRKGFEPIMPGFQHAPFNDFDALKAIVSEKTAAIILEPVQGEGGIIPADLDYLKKVRALCDDMDILLMFDEVQCGMGRLGTIFGFQHFGVEPDVFSLAKALGNGFPIGAFVVRRKYAETLAVGEHASTFGGTALACAAALAVLETIEKENVLENCRERGKELFDQLSILKEKYDTVRDVRGVGLMIGIAMDPPELAKAMLKALQKKGMLALTAGSNVLRLLPPLTITSEEVSTAVSLIDEALSEQ